MVNESCRTSEKDCTIVTAERSVLITVFNDIIEGLKSISFEPEIKVLVDRKNISDSGACKIESPEILQDKRPAVLERKETRRIDNCAEVVFKKLLIGVNNFTGVA
jgi:hypothetical protein